MHIIYDCVIKIGVEHLDVVIKAFDAYVKEDGELKSAEELLNLLKALCKAIDDESIEILSADMFIITNCSDEVKNYHYHDQCVWIKNRLISIYSKMQVIDCDDANDIFPCYEKLVSPEFYEHKTTWRSVAKCDLPHKGIPVLVLLDNGCIGIDCVNEPDSNIPFAHYNVIGWSALIGEHFEIMKWR